MKYAGGMKYSAVLFDLDGTLTDPYLGITHSVQYALGKFHITEENSDKLKLFIGPPLEKSFIEYYGFTANDAKKAVEYYREYFSEKGVYENKLYTGIDCVLQTLTSKNITCLIATSKLEKYAIQVVRNFAIDVYFKHVTGSSADGSLSEKTDIIQRIMETYKPEREKTIMVGDRKYDITGARENGIDSIGVLYGYGTKEEIEEARPTYICKSVEELPELLQDTHRNENRKN
jgi:phosphoglycolate phosphatase